MTVRLLETVEVAGDAMTLRDLEPADAGALLDLHREVFGSAVNDGWYAWKYGEGGGESVGLWHGQTLIAHCGGLPRDFWHEGRQTRDLQIGDVMVRRSWRGVLTRRGPFHHVSRAFYQSRLGSGRFHVGYGFPGDRHLAVAVRTGLLRAGGSMTGLRWDGAARLPLGWRSERLEPTSPAFDRFVASAWAGMLAGAGRLSIGCRDASWLRWRYLRQPGRSVIFLLLRRLWHRQPLGLAVLAPQPGEPAAMQWLDWIGPPWALALACAACRHEAAREGAAHLTAWASPAVALRLTATGAAARSEVARIGMPQAALIPADEAARLDWWFMGGDTDFL